MSQIKPFLRTYQVLLCPIGAVALLMAGAFGSAAQSSAQQIPDQRTWPYQQDGTEPRKQAQSKPEEQKKSEQSAEHERATRELEQEEHQRILRIVPEFNTTNIQNAASLSPKQKFQLAFKSATDPFAFFGAAVDAGFNQLANSYPGYGQGAQGYAKRFGAGYADNFNGTLLGNALFPALLHQDPRYFRRGDGPFVSRALYAVSSTFRARGDSGGWQPNYSNLLGNLAAGAIANAYYPAGDGGVGLTVQRAFVVSAEGAFGALFYEFWPDISRKFLHRHRI